jgi:hypothetical protein
MIHKLFIIASLLIIILSASCTRERPSENPPIHIIKDMDNQPKYKAQAKSEFFENEATMRQPVPGTIPQGYLRTDEVYFDGKNTDGSFVKIAPIDVTVQNLNRGRERFDIYCSPCHSRVGDGKGIMINRGYIPPPTFHSDRLREIEDGHIYDVITNGIRSMPSYAHQIPPDDRWKIVVYMRALQRSQNATIEDIPVELRDKVKQQ